MKLKTGWCAPLFLGIAHLFTGISKAADPAASAGIVVTNGTTVVHLPLVSGVDEFKVLATTNLGVPFAPAPGTLSGYEWIEQIAKPFEFFRVQMTTKDSNSIVAATLLNRLAYGPTPDDLERVAQIGPQAYINEQLAPEKITETLEVDRIIPATTWQRVTQTATAGSSTLYLYLSAATDCYIDDIQIVAGNVAESGVNKVINGDFENGLTGWTIPSSIFADSEVSTQEKHSGSASLHLVASTNSANITNAVQRKDLGLVNNAQYTLSYWYKAGATGETPPLTIRLSSGALTSSPGNVATKLAEVNGVLNDLTAWHMLHAVQSKKQLLEVLLQFLENHFVTQQTKSMDYLDRYYDGTDTDKFATSLEYFELNRWREALLNPQCTFYDLLKISAESPAMIIYLDTVGSKGNGSNIANENYARELLELFTFGVDNGYDQNDITVMSRVWTGWSIELVDPTNRFNPFALRTTNLFAGATNPPPGKPSPIKDLNGAWAFSYKPQNHNTSEKVIFPGKVVPSRFGPPYAGRNYELRLVPGGNNGDWQRVTLTGKATTSTLYIYIASNADGNGTGDCYIDDIKLVSGNVPEEGPNMVQDGDFESALTGWKVSANLSGSTVVSDVTHSGNGALHVVSSASGSSQATSIWRADLGVATNETVTLSYWYKPGTIKGDLTIRLSGSSATGDGIFSSPGSTTNTIQEGYTAIAHLADQPFTQEFICVKLCRLFVHEDFATGYDFTDPNLSPEGRLVRDCMRAWEENVPKGQIRKVLEVIFNSDLFRSEAATMQKVKTPFEFVVSAIRALRSQSADGTFTADSDGYALRSPINRMGRMRLFDRDTPDGYPEAGAPWISAGTLTERLRFAQALLVPTSGAGDRSDAGTGNVADPVKLLKAKLPQASWKDANAVASYFAGILFPSEGKANLDQYRSQAIDYLNTADDGSSSPFATLVDTGTPYSLRVRGMVAMLMTFPRFQEQ